MQEVGEGTVGEGTNVSLGSRRLEERARHIVYHPVLKRARMCASGEMMSSMRSTRRMVSLFVLPDSLVIGKLDPSLHTGDMAYEAEAVQNDH